MLEAHEVDDFHRNGFVIVRALLDAAEVELVEARRAVRSSAS